MKKLNSVAMTDNNKSWVHIEFIGIDGNDHTFYSSVNKMCGDRLSGFDHYPPTIKDSISWISSIITAIFSNCDVNSYGCSKHFEKMIDNLL